MSNLPKIGIDVKFPDARASKSLSEVPQIGQTIDIDCLGHQC